MTKIIPAYMWSPAIIESERQLFVHEYVMFLAYTAMVLIAIGLVLRDRWVK